MKFLTIRRAQMDVFDALSREAFRERAFRTLGVSHPKVLGELGAESFRDEVRAGIDRGVGYGLRTENDLLRFLVMLCDRGFDFERRPDTAWAKKILDNPVVVGGSKLDLIERLS